MRQRARLPLASEQLLGPPFAHAEPRSSSPAAIAAPAIPLVTSTADDLNLEINGRLLILWDDATRRDVAQADITRGENGALLAALVVAFAKGGWLGVVRGGASTIVFRRLG